MSLLLELRGRLARWLDLFALAVGFRRSYFSACSRDSLDPASSLERSERDVQRFATQPDSDGIHRHAFLVENISIRLAAAVTLIILNVSRFRDRFQPALEVPVGFCISVWEYQIGWLNGSLARLFTMSSDLSR